jgi:tetratricopeptide (TPR) repeat protein
MFLNIAATACDNKQRFGVQLQSSAEQSGNSDFQYAACCLESALQADFASADAYYYLGLLGSMRGRFAEAAQSFMHCLDIRPDYAPALKGCAAAFIAMGRLEQAAEKATQAEAISGADAQLKILKRKIRFTRLKNRITGFLRKLRP